MINYDKWKLLNENFMISQPLGIKKTNGFLAYNKLHEDEEIEDDDVEYEIEDDMEDDVEDMDGEDMEDEDMEDEDMEDMDGEDMEDDDMEDMDDEEYEDEDMEDEDHEEMEDEEYEDMEDEEHEDHEEMEDEGPMMGRVRSHHHSHDKHLSRPHHEMDTDEIDFAAKASDKMSKMYANCESMEYKMPSMNEWLSSVNGMMFPEELNDYIGKKGNVISEAKEEEDEEEEGVTLSSRFNQLEAKIKQIGDQSGAIQGKQFAQLTADLVKALKPHVTGKLGGGLEPKLQKLMDAIGDFIGTRNSKPKEKSILDRTKPSMNAPKYMKKGCGHSMKMMPKKMKMSAKKSSKNCGYSSKNMKKSTKR